MLTILLIAALTLNHPPEEGAPQAECKSAYGATSCGFYCVAAYGEVRCAKTPRGRCEAAYGKVTCWDPEQAPRRGHHRLSEASCLSAYGQTVCGYGCTSAYGMTRCAKTPLGVCTAAYGEVVCWDPPEGVTGSRGPKAACRADYGKIACGYGCTAAYGQVRCASRPGGVCQAAYGRLTCSD